MCSHQEGLFSKCGLNARLVAASTDRQETNGSQASCRQMPLVVEDSLTLVIEIPETVIPTERVQQSDIEVFCKCKYQTLTADELEAVVRVPEKAVFDFLSRTVPCVGCRKSIERLYCQLKKSGQPALEPIYVTTSGELSLHPSYLSDPSQFYALFYLQGNCLNEMVESIHKNKRNRRCGYHSLDSHRLKSPTCWMDVWDLLSQECREEVTLIDCDALLDTIDNYLRKHRFCSECKSKVLRAYAILADGLDSVPERGYCSALFNGLRGCSEARHIHVTCETTFLAHLIGKAEPQFDGSERHAKTMDIAQEEVLVCVGIHLWERLNRIWQKLKTEEQTWQMLFFASIEIVKNQFEVAVEAKRGVSNLEKLVDEFQQEEDAKERRRELKRLKKKQKRASKAQSQAMPASCLSAATNKEQEETVLDESVSSTEYRAMCGSCSVSYAASASSCSDVEQAEEDILCGCCPCDSVPLRLVSNCGLPSGEPEKSNLVDGWLKDQSHNDCIEDEEQQQILQDEFLECHQHQDMAGFVSQLGLNTLEGDHDADESSYIIPQEDINVFFANKQEVEMTRQQLRERLKENFEVFSRKQMCSAN